MSTISNTHTKLYGATKRCHSFSNNTKLKLKKNLKKTVKCPKMYLNSCGNMSFMYCI